MARLAPKQAIDEMVRRIVTGFDPDQVILFGSYARGDADEDSDVDLAVILPDVPGTRREMAVRMRVALNGMGICKDILVLTAADYAEQKPYVGTLGHILAREGRVLYARKR